MLHLSVVGDILSVEADEELTVQLTDPVNAALGDATGTVTLRDDDVLPVSVSDAAVVEGHRSARRR